MKTMLVKKKSGKFRRVFMPETDEKRRLRSLVPQLNLLAEELDVHHVCHGFTEGRSPVTNALCHVGFEYTISMDMQDWFDSVTLLHAMRAAPGRLGVLRGLAVEQCFVEGIAGQGLPTSPAICNIAATHMFRDIMLLCPKGRFVDRPFVFTAYADDLCFSTNSRATVDLLLQEIPKIVERHGLRINTEKTKVQCAKAGLRIITGIAVGQNAITIPRETRRRIRAGDHQTKAGMKRRLIRRLLFNQKRWRKKLPLRYRFHCQLQGLKEWARLKRPRTEKPAQNKVLKAVATVVTAVVGQKIGAKLFGSWGRRFG